MAVRAAVQAHSTDDDGTRVCPARTIGSSSSSFSSSSSVRWKMRSRSHVVHLLRFLLILGALFATTSPLLSISATRRTPPNELLGPGCPASTSNHTVRVGIFLCPSPSVVVCWVQNMGAIMDIWRDHVNNNLCGLLGTGTAVEFVPRNLSGLAATSSEIRNHTRSMLREGIDFVILPPGSLWASAMVLLEAAGVPALAPLTPSSILYQCTGSAAVSGQSNCVSANTRRFQYAHSVSSPAEQYLQGWIGLLQLKEATTIAVVSTALTSYPNIVSGLETAVSDYHMTIIGQFLNLPTLADSSSVATSVINEVVAELQELNADAVAILASDCRPWIQRLQEVNYLPKSLATLLCTDSQTAEATLGSSLNYIVGPAQWDSQLTGSEYTETNDTTPWGMFIDNSPNADSEIDITSSLYVPADADEATIDSDNDGYLTSPLKFVKKYQDVLNFSSSVVPGYDSASVLAPLTMLHGAIETAGTVDAATVNTALQLYYAPSFFGLLTTDRYGMNEQKQLALLQRDVENELNVIYPLSSATLDFIYPMPQFDERVYVHRMFAIPVELVFIGLLSACALFTLALCVYLLYHRGNQIFQAAGVQWYMFMGLGCIVAYLSILSWTVENNQTSCDIRIWAWTTAFHAFVGPMVSCALRIARIYTQGLQSVRVSNMQVAGYCLGLYLPQLVLNLFWTIFYPLRTKVIELDSLRPKYDYTICTGDDTATVIFGSVTLVYSGMMLITACFLAWRVRKAYAIFNDAKPIALSMYIFTLVSLVVVVVQLSFNSPDASDQRVLFALRSAGVLIAYQSSIAILFLRRILDQIAMGAAGNINDTAIGTTPKLEDPSGHLKSEISDAVWRNDQKRQVDVMFLADTGGIGGTRRPAETAEARALWLEDAVAAVAEPPAALFSRGDSSTPTTPVRLSMQEVPLVAPEERLGVSPTLQHLHSPHTPSPQGAQAIGMGVAAIPDPRDTTPSPPRVRTGPSPTPPRRKSMRRDVPGQAMTQSALHDEADTAGDRSLEAHTLSQELELQAHIRPVTARRAAAMVDPGVALPALLSLDTDQPDTPLASMFHIDTDRTNSGAATSSTAHLRARTHPHPLPSAAVLAAAAPTAIAASAAAPSVFPLPSVPQLHALAPRHFFAWREQVRQHGAMLLVQHAIRYQAKHANVESTSSDGGCMQHAQMHPYRSIVGSDSGSASSGPLLSSPRFASASPSSSLSQSSSPSGLVALLRRGAASPIGGGQGNGSGTSLSRASSTTTDASTTGLVLHVRRGSSPLPPNATTTTTRSGETTATLSPESGARTLVRTEEDTHAITTADRMRIYHQRTASESQTRRSTMRVSTRAQVGDRAHSPPALSDDSRGNRLPPPSRLMLPMDASIYAPRSESPMSHLQLRSFGASPMSGTFDGASDIMLSLGASSVAAPSKPTTSGLMPHQSIESLSTHARPGAHARVRSSPTEWPTVAVTDGDRDEPRLLTAGVKPRTITRDELVTDAREAARRA